MAINFPLWSPTRGDIPPSVLNEAFGGETLVNTTISTVGAGTLTAAAFAGGSIVRQGPVAAFTDTTDTAAAIVTALGGFSSGDTFLVYIKNLTLFPMTVTGGTGVTWSGVAVIPPLSTGVYFGTQGGTVSAPTLTFAHISTAPWFTPGAISSPQGLALSTVGAGTITAAGITGGFTIRTGSTTAFTDTTDAAANIIAAGVGAAAVLGASWDYTYVNNTVAPATIAGGTGVTVSGATVVPANSWVRYLVTNTAAATVTMVAVSQGFFPVSGTVTANQATPVVVSTAAVTAGSNIILTYASGSVGATGAFVSAKTAGTSFSIKSVTGDTAVYNWTIVG